MSAVKVKICGITRAVDARSAVSAGADAIGLVFAPSPRQVTLSQAECILSGLPIWVLRVGVFVRPDFRLVEKLAVRLGLDRVQVHGEMAESELKKFPAGRVIRVLRPDGRAAVPAREPSPDADAYLVDAFSPEQEGGTGRLANWGYARRLGKFGKSVILSGGLNAGNVRNAIRMVRPAMVDVSSGVEVRPGIKSGTKMREFIRLAKTT